MSKAIMSQPRRKPQSFTTKDLELLKETLQIPHESRTLVFEFLAHTHPEHSMKSWHSFYHKKVSALGPAVTNTRQPPEAFTQQEEDALVEFLANGGSFMVDTSPLLYGQPYLRSEASWAKFYHTDKARLDQSVHARRGQAPATREDHDGYLDAMLGSTAVQLGVDPSVARYLPNHSLSRVPLAPHDQHHIPMTGHDDPNHHNPHHHPQQHMHDPYAHLTEGLADSHQSTASPSPGTALEGSEHHYHSHAHAHPHPVQAHVNGVPVSVPYEQHFPSSSTHTVFHHHQYHDPSQVQVHAHPHAQIDPSLRPHSDLHHPHTGPDQSDQHDQLEEQHPQQTAARPKKRRRTKEASAGTPSGAGAVGEGTSFGKTKRRRRDVVEKQPETQQQLQSLPFQSEVDNGSSASGSLTLSNAQLGHEHEHESHLLDDPVPLGAGDQARDDLVAHAVAAEGYLVHT